MKDNKGFTLMELIVVLGILGIISLIAIPRFMTVQAMSKEDACAETRSRIVKHYYLQYVMNEDLDFETYFENLDDYFGGNVVCPGGGTYSIDGDKLVCSEHGHTLVSVLSGNIFYLDVDFNELSEEDSEFINDMIRTASGTDGNWQVTNVDGKTVLENTKYGLGFLENENNQYEISSNIKLVPEGAANGYGIVFESSVEGTKDTGYVFQFDPGYGSGEFLFRQRTDGKESGAQGRMSPSNVEGLTYDPDTFWEEEHEIKLIVEEIDGDSDHKKATAYVDGYEVSSITIDALEDSAYGYMGYRGWGNDKTQVSDIKIKSLD